MPESIYPPQQLASGLLNFRNVNPYQGSRPNNANFQVNQQFVKIENDISNNYKCYSFILHVYVMISVLMFLFNFLSLSGITLSVLSVIKTIGSLLVVILWFVGVRAKQRKNASLQWKFQCALIVYMMYGVFNMVLILTESYITSPVYTFTWLLNQLFSGIIIPFYAYFSGDSLRKLLEEREKLAAQLNLPATIL